MRAAVLSGGRFSIESLADPVPGKGSVLVRPLRCGICGSDLHARHHAHAISTLLHRAGFRGFMNPGEPVVMGHEFVCEILDYGPETRRSLARGTRVVGLPFTFRNDAIHLLGYSNEINGAFAETMTLKEDEIFEVPGHVPTEVAALCEPAAVAVHAVNAAGVGADCAFAVYGCGPIGLLVIARLRHLGFGSIIAIDPDPTRREHALRLGVDQAIAPSEIVRLWWEGQGAPVGMSDAAARRVMGKTAKRPVIFECAGAPGLIRSIAEEAPVGAAIVGVGVCMEPDEFEPALMMQKEQSIRFVCAYSAGEFLQALDMLSLDPDLFASFITKEVELEDVEKAFSLLEGRNNQVKILLRI